MVSVEKVVNKVVISMSELRVIVSIDIKQKLLSKTVLYMENKITSKNKRKKII
jgi:hypothetical protein